MSTQVVGLTLKKLAKKFGKPYVVCVAESVSFHAATTAVHAAVAPETFHCL